jgi:hypothetical protein
MGVTPRQVTLSHGAVVTRRESFPVAMFGGLVLCAPYDNHFIFRTSEPHQSTYQCTCGSPAVIANIGGGQLMFVCLHHMNWGIHATGERVWE